MQPSRSGAIDFVASNTAIEMAAAFNRRKPSFFLITAEVWCAHELSHFPN